MSQRPHTKTLNGIFLSSTNDPEVQKYRLAAKEAIQDAEFRDKWYAVEMGEFLPSSSSSLEECKKLVLSCLVYIGILGPFYGSVNEDVDLSYTEYEYLTAKNARREIGIFLLPHSIISDSDPNYVIDQGCNLERQKYFKNDINSQHTTRSVVDLDDFNIHFRKYLRSLDPKKVMKLSQINSKDAKPDKNENPIHILTGGKGGVGKTLVGLSVVCSYALNLERPVLGIDLNTMNSDLFRLLTFGNTNNIHQLRSWRYSTNGLVTTIRPGSPYTLPDGARGFWDKLNDLISNNDYFDHTIVVDTNLHIANMDGGASSTRPAIRRLLEISNRKIFIWIIWTYASVLEHEIIRMTMRRLRRDFQDKVDFIHVLNPSALMPPEVNLTVEIDRIVRVRRDELLIIQLLQSPYLDDDHRASLQDALNGLGRIGEDVIEHIRDSAKMNPTSIVGLNDLWRLDATSFMDHEAFVSILVEELNAFAQRKFTSLTQRIKREFGGRPPNVLPISTHSPGLIGYTEENRLGENIQEVQNNILTVQGEVAQFVETLEGAI